MNGEPNVEPIDRNMAGTPGSLDAVAIDGTEDEDHEMYVRIKPRAPTRFTGEKKGDDFESFWFTLQTYLRRAHSSVSIRNNGTSLIDEHLDGIALKWWRGT
eukprot:Nk52_evm1s1251 gene=Nk52_evmTU1s1251